MLAATYTRWKSLSVRGSQNAKTRAFDPHEPNSRAGHPGIWYGLLLAAILLPAAALAGVANPDGYITTPGGEITMQPGQNDEGFEFISSYAAPLSGTIVPDYANHALHFTADLDWRGFDAIQYGINGGLPEETSFIVIFVSPHSTDFNCDGQVDDSDLSILLSNWWGPDPAWNQGDVTADGRVNDDDLSVLLADWGPVTWRTQASSVPANAVPEPTGLAILACGAIAVVLSNHRRRRT